MTEFFSDPPHNVAKNVRFLLINNSNLLMRFFTPFDFYLSGLSNLLLSTDGDSNLLLSTSWTPCGDSHLDFLR